LQQTKQKKTESKSKDAPRKTHNTWSNKNIVSWKVTLVEKTLSSRFMRAIGPGCRTGINYSGPMPVPVLAQTGTDGSPHGHARSEGVDHWSRFVARTEIIGPCILGYFCTVAGFCVFFSFIYLLFCIQFNGTTSIQQ
jgi:hypothetical protein